MNAKVIVSNQRVCEAAERSIGASKRLRQVSETTLAVIDEATPDGMPVADLSDEDSTVIALADAITGNGETPKRRARTEPGRDR